MSDAINYTVRRIKEVITSDILTAGFKEKYRGINKLISIDEMIRSQVLYGKVYLDIKDFSSKTVRIPLSKTKITRFDGDDGYDDFIIEIPKSLTRNKNIVSLTKITCESLSDYPMSSGNVLFDNLLPGMEAEFEAPFVEVVDLEIKGNNTLLVTSPDLRSNLNSAVLVCDIESNSSFSHINSRYHPRLYKLALLATKVLLYTKLDLKIDRGYIRGGHEIAKFRNIIDKYEVAEADYDIELSKWPKIENLNNKKFTHGLLGRKIP